jgi:hypothetical protein
MPPIDPYNPEVLAKQLADHLKLSANDIKTIASLPAEEKKAVLKKAADILIDVPYVPAFLEPMIFNFVVEFLDHQIKQIMAK